MSSPRAFPLITGHLGLDLVNTEVVKRGTRHDLLVSESDLSDWLHAVPETAQGVAAPLDEQRIFTHGFSALKELRVLLRQGFERIADGNRPAPDWISQLEEIIERSPLAFRYVEGTLSPAPTGLAEAAIQSLIAYDTLQLLASGELMTLHRCANPDCVLLFLDTTGRRKWCSMNLCGNRTKVARHQRRKEN
ncbi:CGNR zinc finger domain-containing protein [Paenibacillus daejeonensis]|uniref:CGNR zinc finger domain-containing protein n=1 Tax=Paenibacillus daejeonensis TaxID=135193 RepID=UPI00037E9A11|nr:CGNR zinc finger domain-containing protein [Paenibacillus daejeonensis]